jgi:hypothetical protein
VAFFTEAAAQDQRKQQATRQGEIEDWSRQCLMDETGASVDALALGFKPRPMNRSYGGVSRQTVGGRT